MDPPRPRGRRRDRAAGDLVKLSRSHVHATPAGRRIQIRTSKRKRMASIPVTPRLAQFIDETPTGRLVTLGGDRGNPLTVRGMTSVLTYWRDKAGLSPDLRPYDSRGTAITRLLMHGGDLKQIAVTFGWSMRYAHTIIEQYVALVPEIADEVLALLSAKTGT